MIEIRNLHKAFGPQHVLRGVDLKFPQGKITAVMGPSGEGKSVLLKHLIGLLRPDQGEVLVDGVNICRLSVRDLNRVRRKFGMLFQDAALFDYMTVFENVSFPLSEHTQLSDAEIAERVTEKLEEVGIRGAENKLPNELSGGMRKRVGLARALVLDPDVLLFDEPTTGLDPIMTDQITGLIEETHRKHEVTGVVISHDLALTYRIADHVAMLYEGRIVEYSTPELFRRSNQPFVRQFLEAQAAAEKVT